MSAPVRSAALEHLQSGRQQLATAHTEVMMTLALLYGARRSQAEEIAMHVDECINHLDRLLVIVESDLRAERA
jgi:hypothetical protein